MRALHQKLDLVTYARDKVVPISCVAAFCDSVWLGGFGVFGFTLCRLTATTRGFFFILVGSVVVTRGSTSAIGNIKYGDFFAEKFGDRQQQIG